MAEIVLEPVEIVVAAAAGFEAVLVAVDHIAAVPFVRIDCRPLALDIVGLRLDEADDSLLYFNTHFLKGKSSTCVRGLLLVCL